MLRAQTIMQKQTDKGSTKRKAVATLLESPSNKKEKSTTLPLVGLYLQKASCFKNLLNKGEMVREVIVFKPS